MKPFTPLPQQKLMFDHILVHEIAAIFAGMGLGKTASVLAAISWLISNGTIRAALIVAPLRVANLTWPAELDKWEDFRWMKMVSLRTDKGKKAWDEGTAEIYVINYEQLPNLAKNQLQGRSSIPVDMVVWDEITFAKSPTSKRIKSFRPYRHLFRRHVGLTGTPASNGYMDLFAPYRLLDGGQRLGHSITAYRDRYFESDYMGYTYTLREWAKGAIEAKISDITLTLSSEDYLKIPETIHEDVNIVLPPALRKQYRELEKEMLLTIKDKEILAPNAAVLSGKLLQFLSGAIYDAERHVVPIHDMKIEALRAVVAKVKRPMLVVVAYIHEKQRILDAFPQAEIFDEKRMPAWDKGEIPMWVLHPKSGGHGLNLQHGGDVTVWFSLTHSLDFCNQVNARTARTGQKNVTTVFRLLVEDSYEWAVVDTLKERASTQSGLMASLHNLKKLREAR